MNEILFAHRRTGKNARVAVKFFCLMNNVFQNLSLNGIYGTPAVTGTGQGGRCVLYFHVQQTQYIKIQTSAASTIWAIEEIFAVYDTARLQTIPIA
jgi:hypothetical protein